MSGKDSTPQADSGRAHEAEQRQHHDNDDGNAIVQLAEALTRQLQAIAAGNSAQPTLDALQVRLTTHYGALSNMLSNFGRHGTPRAGILSPPPKLTDKGTKLIFARPIEGAAKVVTFDAGGNLLERTAFNASGVSVTNGTRIQTVEIENGQGNAFLFGFVARLAS
jgi:hypothetical protein